MQVAPQTASVVRRVQAAAHRQAPIPAALKTLLVRKTRVQNHLVPRPRQVVRSRAVQKVAAVFKPRVRIHLVQSLPVVRELVQLQPAARLPPALQNHPSHHRVKQPSSVESTISSTESSSSISSSGPEPSSTSSVSSSSAESSSSPSTPSSMSTTDSSSSSVESSSTSDASSSRSSSSAESTSSSFSESTSSSDNMSSSSSGSSSSSISNTSSSSDSASMSSADSSVSTASSRSRESSNVSTLSSSSESSSSSNALSSSSIVTSSRTKSSVSSSSTMSTNTLSTVGITTTNAQSSSASSSTGSNESGSIQTITSNPIVTSASTSIALTTSRSATLSLPRETGPSSISSGGSSSNDSLGTNPSTTTTSSDRVTPSATSGQASASSPSTDANPSVIISGSSFPGSVSSPSGVISSFASSAQSGLPPSATTDITEPIILKVAPFNGNDRGQTAQAKRQAVRNGFVDGSGNADRLSCADATPFELTKSQLLIDGVAVSTNPGFAFVPLRGDPQGTINTTFFVAGGILYWQNQSFFHNRATFCQNDRGVTYATFVSNYSELLDCIEIDLVVSLESQCQKGQISSSNIPKPLTTPSESRLTTDGQQSPASETRLPHGQNIYPLNNSPGGANCFTTDLSWVMGQPTFLGI
ncbi:hypothetical protein GGR57DRAFT_229950 [Xylariaceae sp. FL1272]|nr:hypothetical protein GGR57DRAFT_229950 [Xylariaceae sp. FL1272]